MRISGRHLLLIAGATAAGTAVVYSMRKPAYSGIKLKRTIIINRSAADLYSFWRNFENLPRISSILRSVEVLDHTKSRWTANAPGEIPIQWDAEITKDIPNEMIGWRSARDSAIETAGYVRFEPAAGGRRTVVRVAMEYDLPAGRIGAGVATLLGKRPGAHVEELLHRLKELMETGQVSTTQRRRA